MDQLHKRYTIEQVKVILQGYCQGTMSRAEVEEMLHLNKTRFFALLKDYRANPETFSITYQRETPAKLSARVEAAVEQELLREKELVDNPQLPITSYNYSALRDRLKKKGIAVSATTITARAKQLDCYQPHPKGKAHTREVLTAAIGALVQHDASLHLWSPYASEKWTLITSIEVTVVNSCMPISSNTRVVGRIFRPHRASRSTMAYPSATTSIIASSKVATVFGASMSWKPTTSIPTGGN